MIFRRETIPNFFGAIWKLVRGFFRGEETLASEELTASRLGVCEGCPRFCKESRQCEVCTCFVDVKVALKSASCPLDYWR